jgi:hypothetical protein
MYIYVYVYTYVFIFIYVYNINIYNPGGAVLSMEVDSSNEEYTDVHIDLLGSGRYLLVTNLPTDPLLRVISSVPLGLEDKSYRVDAQLGLELGPLHGSHGINSVRTIEVDVKIIPSTSAPGHGYPTPVPPASVPGHGYPTPVPPTSVPGHGYPTPVPPAPVPLITSHHSDINAKKVYGDIEKQQNNVRDATDQGSKLILRITM